jgi:hypothetical protein
MPRADLVGLFWEDQTRTLRLKQKGGTKKAKVKREKPHPFWLEPNYLPGLQQALAMEGVQRMTGADWQLAAREEHWFSWDTECYENYFAVGFKDLTTGKCDWVEMTPDCAFNPAKVRWILDNVTVLGFNSEKYDATMIALALGGCDNYVLKMASDALIVERKWPMEVLKTYQCHRANFKEQIDLQEVVPGIKMSLKTYGGRMHTKRMQDLPFIPSTILSEEQKAIVRYYLMNDLGVTGELAMKLKGELMLRASMSNQYGINLLSKSDAQIAEQVIRTEYERHVQEAATVQRIEIGQAYQYEIPHFLHYRSDVMKNVLEIVRNQWFVVGDSGAIDLPDELKRSTITIGKSTYQMGIGGLHSTEHKISHYEDDVYTLCDADVASYYPRIILNQQLCPEHLQKEGFLYIYNSIVERRLECKRTGDKIGADSLKIVVNSSFGKFGNKYSILYSPRLVIQVTLTGQLCLLMLIDALESVGIQVVSANTDGVVVKARRDQHELRDKIFTWWQKTCGFELEFTPYKSIHSRDVNSYFAVKHDGKVKRKGAYAKDSLSLTPSADVCADAVEQLLAKGRDIADYIQACNNVFDFVTVRKVKGGAIYGDHYLGEVCRWYHGFGEEPIIYSKNGNRVPQSDGAVPLMETDGTMPSDVNKDWYINKAHAILKEIGVAA